MVKYVEVALSGVDYEVWSEDELNYRIQQAQDTLKEDMRKAKIAYREANGVPEVIRWNQVDKYIEVRKMLGDGSSYGEAARTVGVAIQTVSRWFPNRGWKGDGSSSAFIRKGAKVIDNAYIK